MKTLKSAQGFELTTSQRSSIKALNQSGDWEILKEVTENYIFMLTGNLLIGTETYPGSSDSELKELRGFIRYWSQIKNLVESKEEKTENE